MIEIKPIEDYRLELKELKTNIIKLTDIDEHTSLKQKNLNQIYQILNNNDLKLLCRNILKNKYLENFSYEDLNSIFEVLDSLYKNISNVKKLIDIDIFFEKGNIINIKKLKTKFDLLGRRLPPDVLGKSFH